MRYQYSILTFAVATTSLTLSAQEVGVNQFTFSGRVAFGIKARFKDMTLPPSSATPRFTPEGDAYNYGDGYVLQDATGNFGGQTWYWGNDNSSQIVGDSIGMSRSTATPAFNSSKFGDDPQFGGELAYNRIFWKRDRVSLGLEAAGSYLNINLESKSSFNGAVQKTTDFYPFTPGTTPPDAPYQGSSSGAGFVIGDTPVSSSSTTSPGALIVDSRHFEGDLWGLRLGPYMEADLGNHVSLGASVGPAVGFLSSHASWRYSMTAPGLDPVNAAGSGDHSDVLWGWYAGGKVSWQATPRWSLTGGVQYQSLEKVENTFGGRSVEIDFTKTIYVSLGISYSF